MLILHRKLKSGYHGCIIEDLKHRFISPIPFVQVDVQNSLNFSYALKGDLIKNLLESEE